MPRLRNWLGGLLGGLFKPKPQPAPAPTPGPLPDWHVTLLTLHNEARAARHAGPLTADVRLRAAAQAYADWLAANRTLPPGHTGPGGDTMADRVTAAGYRFRTAGENIARGQPTPEAVFSAWMGSTGHFQNVVNAASPTSGPGGRWRPTGPCTGAATSPPRSARPPSPSSTSTCRPASTPPTRRRSRP